MAERRTNNRVNQEDEKNSKFKRTKKNAEQLQRFITEKGKILPRRVTGACAKAQRQITKAVKRARQIGVLPYTMD